MHVSERDGSPLGQTVRSFMITIKAKCLFAAFFIGSIVLLGTIGNVSAQGQDRDEDRRDRWEARQRNKAERARIKAENERIRVERVRQAEWEHRNRRMNSDRELRDRRYNGNYDANNNGTRYRVYRNGSFYNTDSNGAEQLRQAVNEGYRQGFQAGRSDRNSTRRVSWTNSSVYRSGSYGYTNGVNRSQYQYYFQQGFQRGYQDGSNRRYENDYDGSYEYGTNNNGSMSILGAILNQILNIQTY